MIETLKEVNIICDRHAERLTWAMSYLRDDFPLSAAHLTRMDNIKLAVLDQFTTRFGKLQDLMGTKLFPEVLDITKEPGELTAFIDKLYRLEKIGAIPSANDWLLMREVRNTFAHDYPNDPVLQAAMLNKTFELAGHLLNVLAGIKTFIQPYTLIDQR